MIILFGLAPIIVAIFKYFSQKRKIEAEVEKIKLENKITKEITYGKLKAKSRHENIKDKIQIFQELIALEEKMKSGGKLTADDQKRKEVLEMLKKELTTSFAEPEKEPVVEPVKKISVNKKVSKLQ